MSHHTGIPAQPPGTTSANSMGQPQQGVQTQMMGVQAQHQTQAIASSQSQLSQSQTGGQTVLSRPVNPGQRGMTPPKQIMPPQGQGIMQSQNQLGGGQGHQALLLQQQQQNAMMEHMVANQLQSNKQAFGAKSQAGVVQGQMMRGPSPNIQGNLPQFQAQMTPQQQQQQQQMVHLQQQQQLQQQQLQQQQLQMQQPHQQMVQPQSQQIPMNGNPNQALGMHGPQMRLPANHHLVQQQLQQKQQQQVMLQQQQAGQQLAHQLGDGGVNADVGQQMLPDMQNQQQAMLGGSQHLQVGNGHFPGHGMSFNPQFAGQMPCGQASGFPVNKDVTLTSPLLVNLLQSDISASQFGPGGKQGTGGVAANQAKPKKKKPPRKKKPKAGEGQQSEGLW